MPSLGVETLSLWPPCLPALSWTTLEVTLRLQCLAEPDHPPLCPHVDTFTVMVTKGDEVVTQETVSSVEIGAKAVVRLMVPPQEAGVISIAYGSGSGALFLAAPVCTLALPVAAWQEVVNLYLTSTEQLLARDSMSHLLPGCGLLGHVACVSGGELLLRTSICTLDTEVHDFMCKGYVEHTSLFLSDVCQLLGEDDSKLERSGSGHTEEGGDEVVSNSPYPALPSTVALREHALPARDLPQEASPGPLTARSLSFRLLSGQTLAPLAMSAQYEGLLYSVLEYVAEQGMSCFLRFLLRTIRYTSSALHMFVDSNGALRSDNQQDDFGSISSSVKSPQIKFKNRLKPEQVVTDAALEPRTFWSSSPATGPSPWCLVALLLMTSLILTVAVI